MGALALLLPIMPSVIQLVQSSFGHKPGADRMKRALAALSIFLGGESKIDVDKEELQKCLQGVYDQMKANGQIAGFPSAPQRIFLVQGIVTPLEDIPEIKRK